jgi:hypothetical protein
MAVVFALPAACGRDPDLVPLREARGPLETYVPLGALDLADAAGFDRLDRVLADSGIDPLRVYDDLARLAPGNRLVLFRAGVAAADVGGDKARSVAEGVLARLRELAPDDADTRYLGLVVERGRLAGPDGAVRVDGRSVEAARRLVEQAATFASSEASWIGPMGASATTVLRLGREVGDAIAAFEADTPPGSPPEATPPRDEGDDGE